MEQKEEGHLLTIVARPKMDAPGLVAAQCSCGYLSAPGNESNARRAWEHHAEAKAAQSDG